MWFAALLLNDQHGLQDINLVDTTRKRFLKELEQNDRAVGSWVTLPADYALQLVREAVDLTREVGGGLPTRYRALRDVFGEASAAPEPALVYETIRPVEASFNPNWLEDSPRLLGEPEVAGWHVTVPPDLRARALALKRQAVSSQDAGMQLSREFTMKYSDWPNMNVGGFVQRIYDER